VLANPVDFPEEKEKEDLEDFLLALPSSSEPRRVLAYDVEDAAGHPSPSSESSRRLVVANPTAVVVDAGGTTGGFEDTVGAGVESTYTVRVVGRGWRAAPSITPEAKSAPLSSRTTTTGGVGRSRMTTGGGVLARLSA
jgi:hypothetical protein